MSGPARAIFLSDFLALGSQIGDHSQAKLQLFVIGHLGTEDSFGLLLKARIPELTCCASLSSVFFSLFQGVPITCGVHLTNPISQVLVYLSFASSGAVPSDEFVPERTPWHTFHFPFWFSRSFCWVCFPCQAPRPQGNSILRLCVGDAGFSVSTLGVLSCCVVNGQHVQVSFWYFRSFHVTRGLQFGVRRECRSTAQNSKNLDLLR